MPRKTASRLELRRQAEAAEKVAPKEAKAKVKKKKKAATKRTSRRAKDAAPERKRLVWVIYTATLREEARFPYDQRAEAEERLEQLKAKGKRTYFLQPVKELLSGSAAPIPTDDSADDDPDTNEDLGDETNESESEAEFDDSDFEDSDDDEVDDDDEDMSGGDDD